jgi:inner membrane protein
MNSQQVKTSVGIKMLIIGGLVILLLIPSLMIHFIIYERENRRREVVRDITSKWGEIQQITGPVMSIPVEYQQKDNYGNLKTCTLYIYLLPDSVSFQGELYPEVRYRGIYQITLYNSSLAVTGNFNLSNIKDLNLKNGTLQYQDAVLEFAVSDLKGVTEQIQLKWNGQAFDAEAGILYCSTLQKGFHIKSPLSAELQNYPFTFDLHLNGSEEIRFTPIGKQTQASLAADWQHPSFTGDFLPKQRTILDNKFQAEWTVLNLNRNLPQVSFDTSFAFDWTFFGVQLLYPVDQYQKTTRTVKYAIMFISLTFLAFFLIEVLSRKLLHPIQYLLVGLGLILFYILLLSLAEHLSFPLAYLLASFGLILKISLYSKAILHDRRFMLIIAGVLSLLYGFLYVNLQLQDYALLIGSLGLFIILSIVMYITRNINWYTVLKVNEKEAI